jgi:hypothetical protein
MREYQQQEPRPGDDVRAGFNFLIFVMDALAMCLIPFIRINFGIHAPGNSGVMALVLMILAICGSGDVGIVWLILAWFCAMICQRMRAFYLFRKGWRLHSRFRGLPWLAMRFPFVKTEKFARDFEPVICFAIGMLLLPASEGVGGFVIIAAFSLFITRCTEVAVRGRQVTAMRDLEIEQRAMSERLRGLKDDF